MDVAGSREQHWVGAVILTLATLVGMATVILLYHRESSAFFANPPVLAAYQPPPGLGAPANEPA